jgi:D-alanyl-D-alanine carboxypeptidase (penicillin-binding protein 5/6)
MISRLSVPIIFSLLIATSAQAFVPPVPDIAAKAYLLTDYQSGIQLAGRDPDTRVEPASLTKLMTAYLTFKFVKEGKLKLDQQLTVSDKGWRTEGSRMFLDPKKPASVDDLIKGMIVQSGNDACVTLAEAIAGSEEVFAQLMTREAKRLGMTGTNFKNSTGLPDPDHYMTVADLAKLAAAIIHDFPEFYPIYSMKEFAYNNIKQPNRNLLLYSAGYNLVASTKRDGRRLISVVVGAASDEVRSSESSKLLNWGIQFQETPRLYAAKQAVSNVAVWKGQLDKVNVGFLADRFITVPRGDAKNLKMAFTSTQPLIAPIKIGQNVGKLAVSLNGKQLVESPVVALEEVPEANIFGRAWDSIRMWFKSIFG